MRKKIIILGFSFLLLSLFLFIYEDNIKISKNEKKVKFENKLFKNSYTKAKDIIKDMTIEEKIGQLFLVRYDLDNIDLYNKYNPGGYILFSKDFKDETKESIKNKIDKLQEKLKYKLIIAVDEEGGEVIRVSKFKEFREEPFKSNQDIYNEGGYELLEKQEKEKAELLLSLGINLNLAPVVDVTFDKDDYIYSRTFGQDYKHTEEFSKKMVRYSIDNNIGSCLKHFPGYGTNIDTHNDVSVDNRDYESISNNDYLPFISGIKEGVSCILVSHNKVMSIDKDNPASLSKNINSELRDKLKYEGLIITDDLSMGATVNISEASIQAVKAGNDMLITSDFIKMYNEILDSVNNNKISIKSIDNKVLNILSWKIDRGLL